MSNAALGTLLIVAAVLAFLVFSACLASWAVWGVVIFNPFIALLGLVSTPFCFLMGRQIVQRRYVGRS